MYPLAFALAAYLLVWSTPSSASSDRSPPGHLLRLGFVPSRSIKNPAKPSHHRPPGSVPFVQIEPSPPHRVVQTSPPPCTARIRSRSARTAGLKMDRLALPGSRIIPLQIQASIPPSKPPRMGDGRMVVLRPPELPGTDSPGIGISSGTELGIEERWEDLLTLLSLGVVCWVPAKRKVQSALLSLGAEVDSEGKNEDLKALFPIARADGSFKVKVRDCFVPLANSILPGVDVSSKEKQKGPCVLFAELFSQVGAGAHPTA